MENVSLINKAYLYVEEITKKYESRWHILFKIRDIWRQMKAQVTGTVKCYKDNMVSFMLELGAKAVECYHWKKNPATNCHFDSDIVPFSDIWLYQ
jgi:hypothetical protein